MVLLLAPSRIEPLWERSFTIDYNPKGPYRISVFTDTDLKAVEITAPKVSVIVGMTVRGLEIPLVGLSLFCSSHGKLIERVYRLTALNRYSIKEFTQMFPDVPSQSQDEVRNKFSERLGKKIYSDVEFREYIRGLRITLEYLDATASRDGLVYPYIENQFIKFCESLLEESK